MYFGQLLQFVIKGATFSSRSYYI